MAAINRAVLAENLWPGILFHFGSTYKDYDNEWSYIFDTQSSRKAYEEWVAEYNFGLAPVKDAGAPVAYDEAGNAWKGRVEMIAYALGFVITREAVADDQYFELVPKYSRALKRSMVITREVRAAAYVDGAATTSIGGDGVPLASANHPLKSGNTWSNVAAANSDLNETALEAAFVQIASLTDERDLRIKIMPRRLCIPNGMQFTAERLTTAALRPGTGDNDPNAHRQMGYLPEGYATNHYFTDPDQWHIKTDAPEGMLHFDRESLDVQEGDGLDNQVMKVIAYERYAFAHGDPRGWWTNPGTP